MTADLSKADWFKSSHSATQADCVEVAFLADGQVGVRDSKNPSGPALVFQPGAWDAFTGHLVAGDLRRQ
ncbi:DUF397 domain-containing protein [Nocardia gipuzkoensis]|uniref:DUF397 domain-containing protein n=1 Tax=Nocardia gipuzkoensis TaxID=2749991 RepID=UPI001E5A7F70|nr:DUF397 domain-containing protein [Nocardia gipuzkoensis]UGT71434.1 DUF397 domain-containing protein [Nocardia gipuzkoensis]